MIAIAVVLMLIFVAAPIVSWINEIKREGFDFLGFIELAIIIFAFFAIMMGWCK